MKQLSIAILLLIMVNCQVPKEESSETVLVQDTIVGSKAIFQEIAGSDYRKRATAYFRIIKNDTSDFWPIFIEYKEAGRVGLNFRFTNTLTYQEHLEQLKLILPEVVNKYNLDSLSSISIGRLYQSGDLAIDISNQYVSKFGPQYNIPTSEYKNISEFLIQSKLAHDFNSLFKPYGMDVEDISVEKVFFTYRNEVYKTCKVERDSLEANERILDCITYVSMNKSL